jgi:hypothetical protein
MSRFKKFMLADLILEIVKVDSHMDKNKVLDVCSRITDIENDI